MSIPVRVKAFPESCAQCLSETTCTEPCYPEFSRDMKFLKGNKHAVRVVLANGQLSRVALFPTGTTIIGYRQFTDMIALSRSSEAIVGTLMLERDVSLLDFLYGVTK